MQDCAQTERISQSATRSPSATLAPTPSRASGTETASEFTYIASGTPVHNGATFFEYTEQEPVCTSGSDLDLATNTFDLGLACRYFVRRLRGFLCRDIPNARRTTWCADRQARAQQPHEPPEWSPEPASGPFQRRVSPISRQAGIVRTIAPRVFISTVRRSRWNALACSFRRDTEDSCHHRRGSRSRPSSSTCWFVE